MTNEQELSKKMVFGWFAFALVVLLGAGWIAQGNDFFLYKVFAPKYETVRRQTFEQTKSYRQGMVDELENMQLAYVKADSAGKRAMAPIILHRAADTDPSTLTPDLNSFLTELRHAR